MNTIPPKPLKITLGSFQFFSQIRRDIHKSRCTIGINDTGDKFVPLVPLVSWIPVADLPPLSSIRAANLSQVPTKH
jgi:hypothetical protein